MTKIFPFLFIYIFLSSCHQPVLSQNGWTRNKVNGPVEEMLTQTYKAIIKNDTPEPDKSNQVFYEDISFDSSGNTVETYVKFFNWFNYSAYRKSSNDILYTSKKLAGRIASLLPATA